MFSKRKRYQEVLSVSPGYLKYNSGINLSPVNKNLLMIFFILKLIISNIKTKQLPENKILPINGTLLNGVLILNLLNTPLNP